MTEKQNPPVEMVAVPQLPPQRIQIQLPVIDVKTLFIGALIGAGIVIIVDRALDAGSSDDAE